MSKSRTSTKVIRDLVTINDDYMVDGGQVLDEMSGTSRVDLVGSNLEAGTHRAVTLYVPKSELVFYPIGAMVRVTVERLK